MKLGRAIKAYFLLMVISTTPTLISKVSDIAKNGTHNLLGIQKVGLMIAGAALFGLVAYLFLKPRHLIKPVLGLLVFGAVYYFLPLIEINSFAGPIIKQTIYYSSIIAAGYCVFYDTAVFLSDLFGNLIRRFSSNGVPNFSSAQYTNTAEKGAALEEYVCEIYKAIYGNAMTTTEMKEKGLIPNGPGDQGADVVVELPGKRRLIIQCKNYESPIGNDAVQEIMSARAHYNAHELAIVAPNGFTSKCRELAKTNSLFYRIKIDLIDSAGLDQLLSRAS